MGAYWSSFREGGWSLAPRPDKIRRGEAAFVRRGLAAFKFNGAGGWPGRLRLASPRFGHGGRFAAATAARRRHPQARAAMIWHPGSAPRPGPGAPGRGSEVAGPGVDGAFRLGPGRALRIATQGARAARGGGVAAPGQPLTLRVRVSV